MLWERECEKTCFGSRGIRNGSPRSPNGKTSRTNYYHTQISAGSKSITAEQFSSIISRNRGFSALIFKFHLQELQVLEHLFTANPIFVFLGPQTRSFPRLGPFMYIMHYYVRLGLESTSKSLNHHTQSRTAVTVRLNNVH